MPHIVVQPKGIELEIEDGETIFAAAERLGYRWPTVCGGLGDCSTCYMMVDDGADQLSPVSAYEQEGLDRIDVLTDREALRLACQARVHGDVTVTKRGVRQLQPERSTS